MFKYPLFENFESKVKKQNLISNKIKNEIMSIMANKNVLKTFCRVKF